MIGECQKCSKTAAMFHCNQCGMKYCSICKNKNGWLEIKIMKTINHIIREKTGRLCENCGSKLWNSFET